MLRVHRRIKESEVPWSWLLFRRRVAHNQIVSNTLLLKKKKDYAFEDLMDEEKKYRVLSRVLSMLTRRPEARLQYIYMVRRGKQAGLYKPQRMTFLFKRFPSVLQVYREGAGGVLWVGVAGPAADVLAEEHRLMASPSSTMAATSRLRKLLMMCHMGRARLDRIAFIKAELGLPPDFDHSIIQRFPQYFEVEKVEDDKWSPYVKLVAWDPSLAIPAVEKYREEKKKALINPSLGKETRRRREREDYSFPMSYPPGFKRSESFRRKQHLWQRIPYTKPYPEFPNPELPYPKFPNPESLNPLSPPSIKRAVAVIHEFLHLTVEKRMRLRLFAHLREELMLPQRVGITVLEQPGIFYVSTKGGGQTVFLREAYCNGVLIEKDPLYIVKEKMMDLISPKRPKKDNGKTVLCTHGNGEQGLQGKAGKGDTIKTPFTV